MSNYIQEYQVSDETLTRLKELVQCPKKLKCLRYQYYDVIIDRVAVYV